MFAVVAVDRGGFFNTVVVVDVVAVVVDVAVEADGVGAAAAVEEVTTVLGGGFDSDTRPPGAETGRGAATVPICFFSPPPRPEATGCGPAEAFDSASFVE